MTPQSDKKLFLLDAFALIYRAYYAFIKNPRVNSEGQNTSAAFGFTTALLEIIKKEKPTHIAVAFDAPEATNRQLEYTAYKANREAMPEDIAAMIDPIKAIVTAFRIPILIQPGYEADDIIGTVAKKAEEQGFTTYMMTPDKDYAQLVSENSLMYKPSRGKKPAEVWGVSEVKEKFGVAHPEQVIDILGLWGDAVDNIPGVPGIGEKTAKKLVQQYGSVEGLIAHAHELKGKQRENVIAYAQQAIQSKQLATIILDVPIAFDPDQLRLQAPDRDKIAAIFTQLEFRTLARKVIGEEIVVGAAPLKQPSLFDTADPALQADEPTLRSEVKTIADCEVDYRLVTTKEERMQLLEQLLRQPAVCFDTETTGVDAASAAIVGLAFSFQRGTGFYVATPPDERAHIVREFRPFFESRTIEKIAHNIKYDIRIIEKYGVSVSGPLFDTMIAHYLMLPEGKQGMDSLSQRYLNYRPISIETLIGKKGKQQKSMGDIAPEEIVNYACEDADITFQLKELFEPEMQQEHLKALFYSLEMSLVKVLNEMETAGIRLDVVALNTFSEQLTDEIIQLEAAIRDVTGAQTVNLDSPKQLGELLFERMQIDPRAKKTRTGQYATSEDTLRRLVHKHPVISLILNYRTLRKLKNTYVDTLPKMVDQRTDRVHTSYLQTVTATGRLSSNRPNLQNIPIRTERGREIRKAFIAADEHTLLLSADYSQIELRIIAALSGDANMIGAFHRHEDIHTATAAKVYGVQPSESVTREQRSAAKAVNFGIIYGQSAFGLAQNLGISRREAKTLIDNYWEQYPGIKQYMVEAIAFAREHGYVETIMKRRRYLKDIRSSNAIVRGFAERNAVNAPIQGSAADIIKQAMIRIHAAMKEQHLKSKMLLQVHDELVFDVVQEETAVMEQLVRSGMEQAVEMAVPLKVDAHYAHNWLDAH